jgi:hypothetical protein
MNIKLTFDSNLKNIMFEEFCLLVDNAALSVESQPTFLTEE